MKLNCVFLFAIACLIQGCASGPKKPPSCTGAYTKINAPDRYPDYELDATRKPDAGAVKESP